MKIAEQISVTITQGAYAGKTLLLDVEEFQPYEPSNYCWTPGWNCAVEIRGEAVWFFVDEAGVVYDEANDTVGLCPSQEAEYERRCAAENAYELLAETGSPVLMPCACGDPGDCAEVH